MMWLIMMVMHWIQIMFTIQEQRVKAQILLNKNKRCGLGAEGSEVHLYFSIYAENCIFSHIGLQRD